MKIVEPFIEVEKYDGKQIMKNIERACRTCFTQGTEILTEFGWKKIENLKSEKVLTYNSINNMYEYEDNNLLVKNYDGDIIECVHANINFEITPEHRLYCSSQLNRNYKLVSADIALKNIKRLPKWFKNCKALNNNDYVDTITHSIEIGNRGHNTVVKDISFEVSDDLLNLIGAYISEGHINHIQSYINKESRDKKSGVNIQITQKENKPLYIKVIQALNNLNMNYRIDSDPRKPEVKWIIITGGLPIANWFIEECGYKSSNVHLPSWFRKLSVRQLNVLKDILYEGDGSHNTTRNDRYLSSSSRLLDDIQELFILIGKSASKSENSLGENHRDSWKINPKQHIIYKKYKGKVYCTQTTNGIICIRKNNKTMWIGNCYRSEGLITDDSYKTLIKNCINRGHESVLEHEKITVRMTCDIGCYDKDTKVLTTNGWKYIKDIDVTLDKVYTMTNAGDIVVSPIMSKIEKEYEGNLYNFKNTIIDLAVTPDHNMWIFDTHKRSSQTKIWKFILAKDMNNKSYKFDRRIKPSVDKGVSIKEIPAVSYNNKEYPSIIIKDNNAFFELLGWFITDGSLEKQGNYIRCRISQTKKFGRERIEIILNKLDIDYSYSDKSFTIKCPQLNHFIYDNFYRDGETKKSLTMFVPDIIRNGYLNEIESFVKGVLGGNGYTKSTGTKIIYTASEKFAEDLVELLFKIGINANYHITPSLNKYEKSFKQNASVYVVSIHKNQSITWWDRNENNFNYIPYNDKVYCLELAEHHRLYIMRNGKTCWCGN